MDACEWSKEYFSQSHCWGQHPRSTARSWETVPGLGWGRWRQVLPWCPGQRRSLRRPLRIPPEIPCCWSGAPLHEASGELRCGGRPLSLGHICSHGQWEQTAQTCLYTQSIWKCEEQSWKIGIGWNQCFLQLLLHTQHNTVWRLFFFMQPNNNCLLFPCHRAVILPCWII